MTVHTNHPKQKIVQIPVSGFVRPVVAITPPVADFGKIELKEPLKKALNIRNFATEPIKVTSVDPNLPKGIDAKLETLEEGREYQVRIILNPDLAKGPFLGKLVIHTDSPKVPTHRGRGQGDRRLKGSLRARKRASVAVLFGTWSPFSSGRTPASPVFSLEGTRDAQDPHLFFGHLLGRI